MGQCIHWDIFNSILVINTYLPGKITLWLSGETKVINQVHSTTKCPAAHACYCTLHRSVSDHTGMQYEESRGHQKQFRGLQKPETQIEHSVTE